MPSATEQIKSATKPSVRVVPEPFKAVGMRPGAKGHWLIVLVSYIPDESVEEHVLLDTESEDIARGRLLLESRALVFPELAAAGVL